MIPSVRTSVWGEGNTSFDVIVNGVCYRPISSGDHARLRVMLPKYVLKFEVAGFHDLGQTKQEILIWRAEANTEISRYLVPIIKGNYNGHVQWVMQPRVTFRRGRPSLKATRTIGRVVKYLRHHYGNWDINADECGRNWKILASGEPVIFDYGV